MNECSGMLKGTTLIAIEFEDGVIIGTDSRITNVTSLEVVNRFAEKLVKIRENIYCCGAGVKSYIENVIDLVKDNLYLYENHIGEKASLKDVVNIFRNVCENNPLAKACEFIIAGYDENRGDVYSITNGMLHKEPFAVHGSGSDYIFSYSKQCYRNAMTESEGVEFVSNAIKCGINSDIYSGGWVDMVIITEQGVERKKAFNTESGNPIEVM